jgi:hypothetical protein
VVASTESIANYIAWIAWADRVSSYPENIVLNYPAPDSFLPSWVESIIKDPALR